MADKKLMIDTSILLNVYFFVTTFMKKQIAPSSFIDRSFSFYTFIVAFDIILQLALTIAPYMNGSDIEFTAMNIVLVVLFIFSAIAFLKYYFLSPLARNLVPN